MCWQDGRGLPRGGLNSSLPGPRLVSARLHHESPSPDNIKQADQTPHRTATHMYCVLTRPCTALKFETNPLCSDCASCARTKY